MTPSLIPNGYPIFEANQVLKYTDLQTLFDYLDGHTRLTRTHLIGMGIVCGLAVDLRHTSNPPAIAISAGCGLTSEGDVIDLATTLLTHSQTVTVPDRLFQPSAPAPAASNGNGTNGNGSALTGPTHTVIELFSGAADDRTALSEGRTPAQIAEFVADRVVVVVIEPSDTRRDSCLVDCDDRGRDRRFARRFFLLPRTAETDTDLSAETLLHQGYGTTLPAPWDTAPIESLVTARQSLWQQPELRVRRLGYHLETPEDSGDAVPVVRLSHLKTFADLMANYGDICEAAIAQLGTALPQLYRLFSPLFCRFQPAIATDFEGVADHLRTLLTRIRSASPPSQLEAVEAQYAIQYFYDYLSLLVAAYWELAEAAFDLMADCPTDPRRFPKYLMLGEPRPAADRSPCEPPSAYRSHFLQPPLYNGNAQRLQRVQHLYERLRRLCAPDAFFMLPFYDTPLAITPSADRAAPLSHQAIPYYLNYPNLYRYWNYDACRKGISDRHPAYFHPLDASPPVTSIDLLAHRIDAYPFYRIEGHIGEPKTDALEQIKTYQARYNLAFDVIVLKLAPSLDSLEDLNLSGSFDDLEADFGRLQDKFRKLWDKHETRDDPRDRWSRNVFLNTLRREFFNDADPTSGAGLHRIRESQLQNPILALARRPENYVFVAEPVPAGQATQRFWLYVVDREGTQVARFSPQPNLTPSDDLIDFSGLSDAAIATEQDRIRDTLAACFGLAKVRFEVIPQSARNPLVYFVRLALDSPLDLPADPESNQPRGEVAAGLLWLTPFTISIASEQPYLAQPEFHDFETLYRLLHDIPPGFADERQLPFRMGDRDAADCLNYFEFRGLMEVYRQRLERLKELHLFHNFAAQHPGLEPLGGVPQGGTFVLVYVDGEVLSDNLVQTERNVAFRARTSALQRLVGFPFQFLSALRIQQEVLNRADVVVADFCLPYRCCNHSPTVSYLLAKPRPIVLLEKSAFCRDDAGTYEFILDPAGGVLKGEGTYREGDTYYFEPSRIAFTHERTVTFTYAVEGSYDTFTVALHPDPVGTLNLEAGSLFCNDDGPVDLRLNADPAIDLLQITANGVVVDRFDPRQYARNAEPETVTLVAQIRDRRTLCEAEISVTVTVHPLPNAAFRFDPPTEGNAYCAEEGEQGNSVGFIPDDLNVSDRFEVNGEPLERIFLDNFSRIREPVRLTVVHYARNEADCVAQAEDTLTIYPIPRAVVRVAANRVCSSSDPIAIEVAPDSETATLRAVAPNGDILAHVIDIATRQFNPATLTDEDFGDTPRLPIQIVYEVVGEGQCIGQDTAEIIVYRTPETNFEIAYVSVTPNGATVRVFNIRPQGSLSGLAFQWNTNGGDRSGGDPNDDFTVTYTPVELRERGGVVITLQVYNILDGIYCTQGLVERRLLPPDFDDGDDRPTDPRPPVDPGDGPDLPIVVRDGDRDLPIVRRTDPETARFFRDRLVRYQAQLEDLGERNRDLQAIRAFTAARRFLAQEDKTLDAFRALTEALQRSFRPAGPERQSQLNQVLAIAIAAFFDHLVQTADGETDLTDLETLLENLRRTNFDLSPVGDIWAAEPLVSRADPVLLERLEDQR